MKELYQKNKLFFIIVIVAVCGFLVWYFREIVVFIIVASVLSIIGGPLVERLDKLRIGKIRFPHGLSVTLVLILLLVVFFGLFSFFIPLVIQETQMIAGIDTQALYNYYRPEINWLQASLHQYGVIKRGATLESSLKEMVHTVFDVDLFSNIIGALISFTGTFFFNIFSILFLTFFFLYDTKMVPRLILLLVNNKYEEKTRSVMTRSKTLIARYFIGLIIQILLNITFYSIALSIIGVKGALVIGFFAGIIIIIPYLGGIIAVITGIILGVTGVISAGEYALILPMAIKVFIAMIVVQLIDNNIFQPFIQGKSVRAHPVEIFLVVIAAASIGGIPAMIVAVPAYGFLKILATEFLSKFPIVQSMGGQ
jgi:predicted PurR-regulated permease PerM